LKKQSQFANGHISVSSYMKGNYDNITVCEARKNKAKQTQFYLAPRFSGGLKGDLKKQSQFLEEQNWRNFSIENGLWRFWRMRTAKKQSQFKACPFEFLRAGSERSRTGST